MHSLAKQPVSTNIKKFLTKYYAQVAVGVPDPNDFTDSPQYPPIQDNSLKAIKQRKRDAVHERIKQLTTVEDKQLALNLPRYYGFKNIMLLENKIPYNSLAPIKFYTRTHLIPCKHLPEYYKELEAPASEIVSELKPLVEEVLECEYHGVKHNFEAELSKPVAQQKEDALGKSVVAQINRLVINKLSQSLQHMLTVQVDVEPRHEAFWFIGGIIPPNNVTRFRKSIPWLKDNVDEPVDRSIQYTGSPFLSLRADKPLRPLIPYSDADNIDFRVPKFEYPPQTVGFYTEHTHGANIPGYWPGERDEYGLLSIHGRGHILDRKPSFGEEDNLEALHSQGIMASFGWLLAQANFQGFTTYNDITYPLTTQSIITNGQLWSLYAYQLNTIVMHGEKVDQNPKHNVCFGTDPLKLFEGFNEKGKVEGFNDDVLKSIVQFYMNAPEARDHEMKPYLGKEEKYAADITNEDRREWLEKTYKQIISNRPRHRLQDEIYNWEYIYKIVHKTRPHEPRRRPFELYQNPNKRKLNEHVSEYIPKVLRPYPRHGKHFTRTYYPKIYED